MASVSIPILAANVLASLLWWFILLALGARIRRLFSVAVGPTFRWSVDLALGAWAAAVVLLAAGLFGQLNRVGLGAVIVLLAVAGRWRPSRRPLEPLLAGIVGGTVSLPVALAPPFFYDAMVYHLGLPWQALLEGAWRGHPENLFSTFPPLAQLLALPPLSFGLARVPAMMHWLAWVTAATAVYGLARRFGARRPAAWIATAGCLVLPVAPLVPGFPAAEAWLLLALAPAIAIAAGPCRVGATAAAGLLAGVATAARLQGVPWTALVLIVIAFRCRRRIGPVIAAAACWIAGSLPWWFKNLVLLGDPIAPVLWHREGIETLWRDSLSQLKRGVSLPECVASLPRLLAPELVWLVPLILVAALAVIGRRRNGLLASLALCGTLAWATTGALPRFLAPTVCILLALAATAGRDRLVRVASTSSLVWCCVVGVLRASDLLARVDPMAIIRLDMRAASAVLSPNDPMAAFAESRVLPANARVLFVSEPRVLSFPRQFTAPSQHDPSPLRELTETRSSPSRVVDRLLSDGHTHLLVNWRELQRLGDSYPVAPWRTTSGRQHWFELIRALGPPVVDRDGVQVFALPHPPTRGVGAGGHGGVGASLRGWEKPSWPQDQPGTWHECRAAKPTSPSRVLPLTR
jgi:hypothetical protein